MKNVRFTFLIVFVSIVLSLKAVGNNPPLISGANCQETKPGTIYLEACAGERLCFTVCTNDLDSADKVTISGSTGIKGANFTITNKGNKLETGVFCWTPSESDASKVPYSFVVTAKDNASPVNGSTERKFSITVKEKPKAIYNAIIISCNEARFTAKNIGNTNINQYMWIVNERIVVHRGGNADTVWHHFKNSGKKPYSLTLFGANGCNAIYEDTLTLEYVSISSSDDITLCEGATVKLSASVAKATGSYNVQWSTGDRFYNEGGNTSITVGKYDTFVIASVRDNFCENSDTTFIRINQTVKFDLGENVHILPGEEHVFRPSIFKDTLDADTVFTYKWFKNELKNSISSNPFLVANESATYFLIISDSLNCESIDSVVLRVDSNSSSIGNNKFIGNNQLKFEIFPNPAQKSLKLHFGLEQAYLEIFDVSGQLVFSNQVVNKQSIDISEFSKGSYLMQLKSKATAPYVLQRHVLLKN